MRYSPKGRKNLLTALNEMGVDQSSLSETDMLWRVSDLVTKISPDEAVEELVTNFSPFIESYIRPSRGETAPKSMLPHNARPLLLELADEPEMRMMYDLNQPFSGQQGYLTGMLESPNQDEPLLFISNPQESARCIEIDRETGSVDATIPVIGTTKNSDRLTQNDFTAAGKITIRGTFFSPPKQLSIEKDVPQVQVADVDVDITPDTQAFDTSVTPFNRSYMKVDTFAPGGGASYVSCKESPTAGSCTNHGASCEWWAKCTTLSWPKVLTTCTCMIRP